jgi:chloride channel 7
MEEESSQFTEAETTHNMEREADEEEIDPESNPLNQPLLKRSRTVSSNPLAMVGAKVSYIESLDYEYDH